MLRSVRLCLATALFLVLPGLVTAQQADPMAPVPGRDAAVAAGKRPAIAWTLATSAGHRIAARRSAGGEGRVIGPEARGDDGAPAVAILEDGRALVVAARWHRDSARLWARVDTGSGWQEVDWLRGAGESNHHPVVASADGATWVAWVVTEGDDEFLAAARWHDGALSVPELLPRAPGAPGIPSIMIDGSGQPVVAWSADDGKDTEIWLTRRSASGWQPLQRITDNDVPDEDPDLGRGRRNAVVLAWRSFTPTGYQPWATTERNGNFRRAARLDDRPAGPPSVVGGADNIVAWAAIGAYGYELRMSSTESGLWREAAGAGQLPTARATFRASRGNLVAAGSGARLWTARGRVLRGKSSSPAALDLGLPPTRPLPRVDGFPTLPGTYRAFGDSITEGVVRFNEVITITPGYPLPLGEYIAAYLGRNFLEMQNSGVGGETTSEGLGRLSGLNASDPRQITLIMEGANDAFQRIAASTVLSNLRAMVRNTLGVGSLAIIGNVTPRTDENFSGTNNEIIVEYNTLIRPMATEEGVLHVDQWSAFYKKGFYYSDLLHPNPAGYDYMALIWFRALQPIFNAILMGEDEAEAAAAAAARAAAHEDHVRPAGRQ